MVGMDRMLCIVLIEFCTLYLLILTFLPEKGWQGITRSNFLLFYFLLCQCGILGQDGDDG